MALALVVAQLRAQMALPGYASSPSLGLLYVTDHYAGDAEQLLDALSAEFPEVTDWAGAAGLGICASNAEYFNEPAMSVMLCDLTPDQYQVFNGVAPLRSRLAPQTALVHADPATPDLPELVAELAGRMGAGEVFGGLVSSRSAQVQFSVGSAGNIDGHGAATGAFVGGLSGVAFGADVALITKVTQGAQPIGRLRTVTEANGNLALRLDGEPAFDVLLEEADIHLDDPQQAMARLRSTFVGLCPPGRTDLQGDQARSWQRRMLEADVLVRHIIGVDPGRRGVAVATDLSVGMGLAFCERHVQAARADLMRVCAEIREELEPQLVEQDIALEMADADMSSLAHPARRMLGAVYVSCTGRGGPHFGGPSAELHIIRQALGEVPLVGFFAAGEIAGRQILGYSGVLTVFTAPSEEA
ncbi:FIST N-terminal domain-containing protein [Hydrogenophaga sp. 5NK40-0174]